MDTDQITSLVVFGNADVPRHREGEPAELTLCASHAVVQAGQHLPAV